MGQVLRPVGYTGTRQTLTWPSGYGNEVTAYLWGGGGGGGGDDGGAIGGYGGGGGYSEVTFTIDEGDTLEVAVGGPGYGGGTRRSSAPGGVAGSSLVKQVFNSRNPPAGGDPVYPTSNPAWTSFLNTYGVWNADGSSAIFNRTYTVKFPYTGYYQVTGSCDNYAEFFIDGVSVLVAPGYTQSYTDVVYVTAGNHTVFLNGTNTGGPGGIAFTITGSFSGGRGGNAGPSGSSGAGGGGGGATVLLKNGIVLAVAGGGGGGAGTGLRGGAGSAPGGAGNAIQTNGQNGQDQAGDGGGGGGGAGGWQGGNGGHAGYGEANSEAGSNGASYGASYQAPSGRTPGGISNPYYPGGAARGGLNVQQGSAGYAMFLFQASGVSVHNGVSFQNVKDTYVKANGVWNRTKAMYIKQNGVWQPVLGTDVIYFTSQSGDFGVDSRVYIDPYVPPEPMYTPVIF